jgi:hypothetical protein
VSIDADQLVDEARSRTGLRDLGTTGAIDRLRLQVAAIDEDDGLTGIGRWIARRRLLGLLKARLRFEDFDRRHPESLETELEPPVIVVGLPRWGRRTW